MKSSPQRERGNNGGSCQDCGNKAKRECEHLRCRTCCKSRAFHCPTHVKSTWVPASRRRHHLPPPFSSFLHLTTPNPSSSSFSSGLQQGRRNLCQSFPREIKAVANFRQVRMNSGDNAVVDQAAYHTSVNIGGHIFNGILYDQGPASIIGVGETSNDSADHQFLHHHQLALGGGAGINQGTYNNPNPNPHEYTFNGSTAPPFNALLPGMHFFPHPKP